MEALLGVDFSLRAGEIHALLGENGAGKSTLMHIAYGLIPADQGEILAGGRKASIRSPRDARALGLGMVHQHFTTVPAMTVEENVWLAVGRYGGRADAAVKAVGAQRLTGTSGVVERLAAGLEPKARVETLTVSQQQRLEIVKALAGDAHMLLLDEPTAVLAPAEVEELLAGLRGFVQEGGSAVLITHKLQEVLAGADRVTVLRQGRVTYAGPLLGQSERSLAEAMIGVAGGPRPPPPREPPSPGPVVVRAPALEVRGGELVGVAAIEGNGQRELLRAIAGVGPLPGAAVEVARPVAFIPEDRTTEGLIPGFTLAENVVLGLPNDPRWRRGPWLDWRAARGRTEELIRAFSIHAPGPDAPAGMLSGGNQQRLVFARALEGGPQVVVAENPTRGLDFKATAEVHRRLREIARDGVAVLVYSTDLDEVLELSDRVLVVRQGRVSEAPRGASRAQVGAMMLGLPVSGER